MQAVAIREQHLAGQGARTASNNHERPIRILHSVGHLLRGGIEMWLYQMIKKLDRYEHHVLVRTDREEPFTEDFRQIGARVVPCLNYNNPVKYASNLRKVIGDNGPYDILHVHGSNPNGLLALLLAKPLGIPATVVHSHNDLSPLLKTRGLAYRSYVGLTLQGLRRADRGFGVSALAAQSMFGPSWRKDKRWNLLHCGIDFEPFEQPVDLNLRATLGIPSNAYVVGHVGRFHEQKNHHFLVQIAQETVKLSPDFHFLLIGDGDLRPEITREIEVRGLRRNFTFVPDTFSVPQFMLSAMDCFVFPSRYEGLPLVTVEAQAAGLPCVFSDRFTKESIVDQNLVTMLSLEDSPARWADALLRTRGRRPADQHRHLEKFYSTAFNINRCAASLSETYESLAASRMRRARAA
jgi:glycosyltransferase involved in cell wall biosynthesis